MLAFEATALGQDVHARTECGQIDDVTNEAEPR